MRARERFGRRGAANQVTLARAGLVCLLLAMPWSEPDAATVLWAVAVASVAAVLDGVDGFVARRTGTASSFGARFDMETDAALVLALSLLAWQWDQAGPWVLLCGAARYVFGAATLLLPPLRGPLPPSLRRRVVCVVQVVALIVCLAPWVTPPVSDAVAACGLLALALSFAADTRWLLLRQ